MNPTLSQTNNKNNKAIIIQVKHLSSLRTICDLEWRTRSSDWEKIIWAFSRTVFTAMVMGIAWTVSEIIEHLLFSWLRPLWPWIQVKVNIINTWCILMSAVVTVPSLRMMTFIVSEESLAGDRQADRLRQAGKEADRQTDRQTDRQRDAHSHPPHPSNKQTYVETWGGGGSSILFKKNHQKTFKVA